MELNSNWGLIGHEWAVDLLQGHLKNQRVRHAYLITGPQGIGRRTLAIRLTQSINCIHPVAEAVPCGECRHCRLIEQMQHPDFSVVQADEGARALKVDQIRGLQRKLSRTPYEANYKTALLLRIEDANPNAANALLKTLEEPPPYVIMLLTASDVESLLPTIISRCELIRLRPLSIDQVALWLQTRSGLSDDQALLLAHISGGRPGYALNLSENPQALEQRQNQLDELQRLLSASRVERFTYAEDLAKDKIALQSTLQTWLTFWRDIFLKSAGSSTPLTNIDRKEEIHELAHEIDITTAQKTVKQLERSIQQIENYLNARLVAEVLMLDLPIVSLTSLQSN